MPVVKLPSINVPEGNLESKVAYLTDMLVRYKKDLEYYMNNIDSENITSIDSLALIQEQQTVLSDMENRISALEALHP